jgi:hypothetical protein
MHHGLGLAALVLVRFPQFRSERLTTQAISILTRLDGHVCVISSNVSGEITPLVVGWRRNRAW